jgi:hypothetical protein
VLVKKGKIRFCMDPTDSNKNILRRHFPLKTVEEICANISGSKFFMLMDCRRGFWQVKAARDSQKYLTFSTPWGRYSYSRVPFGISSTPKVFQKIMSDLLSDLKRFEVFMDDILILIF